MLTIHPRYWSFYAWVLDDFWATELPRTRAIFRDFYRPREALFAMACHVCNATEHATLLGNVNGSRRVKPIAHGDLFDPQFDYIKEALGGYGLYYRSAMEMTGVLIVAGPANGFPFDAPTPKGRAIAASYRSAVAHTRLAQRLNRGDDTGLVPREELEEFARVACLCQLRVAEAHDLPLLRDLFLHSGRPAEVSARSETMRMLLDLSACHPTEPIGQADFRQLIYFRQLSASTYTPRSDLVDVARRWRVYQGREYFAYVFNRLLRWVSRRGLAETDGGLTPLPRNEFWDVVTRALDDSANDPDKGLALPGVNASTPVVKLLAYLKGEVEVEGSGDDIWPRHGDLDEHALYESCRTFDDDDGHTLVALLAMILLIRERFGLPKKSFQYANEQSLLAEGGTLRIGMARFMNLLNRRFLKNPTLAELTQWLVEDFVIVQHERVATAKLPDDTYRLRRVGDSLRFFAQDAPSRFNDSRFSALSTTVHELGWVDAFSEPNRLLTKSGQALLAAGDLPEGTLDEAASAFDVRQDSLQ